MKPLEVPYATAPGKPAHASEAGRGPSSHTSQVSCTSGSTAAEGPAASSHVKERPILFSAPMVRALLAGKKTQTRRVIKPQPKLSQLGYMYGVDGPGTARIVGEDYPDAEDEMVRCPYGAPGGELWVRETYAEVHPLQVAAGRYDKPGHAGIPGPPEVNYRAIYKADGEYPGVHFQRGYPFRETCNATCKHQRGSAEGWHGWTTPIFMPRWASRITLEVTGVRVERVQAISMEDAIAEGVPCDLDGKPWGPLALMNYGRLWDTINAKRGFPWASNPWVWVIEFERIAS